MPGVARIPPDRGCNLEPSCLECKQPVCKFDRVGYYEETRRRLTPRVVALKRQGLTFERIGRLVGINRMTAGTWYKKAKEVGND